MGAPQEILDDRILAAVEEAAPDVMSPSQVAEAIDPEGVLGSGTVFRHLTHLAARGSVKRVLVDTQVRYGSEHQV